MSDAPSKRPQLVISNVANCSPLEHLIDEYSKEIDAQRDELLDDFEFFRDKIRELQTLDPQDDTGLGRLYRRHQQRIGELLEQTRDEDGAQSLGAARGSV